MRHASVEEVYEVGEDWSEERLGMEALEQLMRAYRKVRRRFRLKLELVHGPRPEGETDSQRDGNGVICTVEWKGDEYS